MKDKLETQLRMEESTCIGVKRELESSERMTQSLEMRNKFIEESSDRRDAENTRLRRMIQAPDG